MLSLASGIRATKSSAQGNQLYKSYDHPQVAIGHGRQDRNSVSTGLERTMLVLLGGLAIVVRRYNSKKTEFTLHRDRIKRLDWRGGADGLAIYGNR